MHHPVLAGPRRRTRRALLAAALPAALAAAALPSAAEAATAAVSAGPVLEYSARPGETNQVFIRVNTILNKLVISDNTAPITAGNGCTLNAAGNAECPTNVDLVNVQLSDGNDRIEYAAPHQAAVTGGPGNDLFLGALRQAAPGRVIEPVFYAGGTGTDTVSYRFADRGVRVDTDNDIFGTNPDLATDGRPGIDRESVPNDFEIIEGSNLDDTLIGSDRGEVFRGLDGNDQIAALGGDDFIDEGSALNGADTIGGGPGTGDRISYGTRTSGSTSRWTACATTAPPASRPT